MNIVNINIIKIIINGDNMLSCSGFEGEGENVDKGDNSECAS